MDDGSKGESDFSSSTELEPISKLKHELELLPAPEEVKTRILNLSLTNIRAHSGIVPPVEELAELQRLNPDALKIVLNMAVKQQGHDHWMDKGTLLSETFYRTLSIVIAGALVAGSMYGAYALTMADHPVMGALSGSLGALAGVAGIFIRGRDLTRMQDTPSPPSPQPPKGRPGSGQQAGKGRNRQRKR